MVGSYEVTRQSIEVGRRSRRCILLAIISLSLGVINLFPFLPLDGGHIFWALAEKVRGRAIPFSVMERAGFVGFALVIVLFVIGLHERHRPTDRRAASGQVGSAPWPPRPLRSRAARCRRAPIAEAFRITAEDYPDRVAVRTRTTRSRCTWGELRERVDALAGGLAALGVRRGDTVALMLANRPEFHLADLAAMTLGATPFSIYQTSSPEQIAYVVRGRRRAGRDRRGGSSSTQLPRARAARGRSMASAATARSAGATSRARTRTSTSRPPGARSSPTTC